MAYEDADVELKDYFGSKNKAVRKVLLGDAFDAVESIDIPSDELSDYFDSNDIEVEEVEVEDVSYDDNTDVEEVIE